MELLPIFPRHLGIKHFKDIPNKVIDSWKSYILSQSLTSIQYKSSPKTSFLSNSQRLLDDSIFSELKNQILKYSKEYITDLGYQVEDVQISNSWSYITKQNNVEGNFHRHYNSLVSGVFYLTKGSPIVFKTDLYTNTDLKSSFSNSTQNSHTYFNINPQPGLLVLFPSHLEHGILSNHEDITRISIPFNIIPKGEFGPDFAKLYL